MILQNTNPIKKLGISLFFEMQVYLLPFSLFFYQQNGLTVGDFFLFQSIFFFASWLLEIPTGYISDLISRKYIIMIAYLFNCLRLFLYLFFSGYFIVLAGEVCYALCKTFLSGSVDSYVYDYLKQTNSPKMLAKYGRVSSMMSFGTALASLLSAFLYQFWGITGILIVEFIAAIIGIVIVSSLPHIAVYQQRHISFKDLISSFNFIRFQPQLFYFILFAGICFATTALFTTSFQPILKAASVPALFFSVVYFFNHLTRGFASRFTKELNKYLGLNNFCLATMILIGISFLGLFLDLFVHPVFFVLFTLSIACISVAFHLAIQITAVSKLHDVIPQKLRATCSSMMNMMLKCSSGIVLYLFKNSSERFGNSVSYILFGVLIMIMLIILYRKIDKEK